MKIYTKGGDKGKTSLYGGTRISKSHTRIDSYGHVDELNSFLGLLISKIPNSEQNNLLKAVQQQLFVIGSHLAAGNDHDFKLPTIENSFIEDLEKAIDGINDKLEPLKHFVMPGGSEAISLAHVCRTVARRAERAIVALDQHESVEPVIIQYMNRLSDYFFILSRYIALIEDIEEVKWIP